MTWLQWVISDLLIFFFSLLRCTLVYKKGERHLSGVSIGRTLSSIVALVHEYIPRVSHIGFVCERRLAYGSLCSRYVWGHRLSTSVWRVEKSERRIGQEGSGSEFPEKRPSGHQRGITARDDRWQGKVINQVTQCYISTRLLWGTFINPPHNNVHDRRVIRHILCLHAFRIPEIINFAFLVYSIMNGERNGPGPDLILGP